MSKNGPWLAMSVGDPGGVGPAICVTTALRYQERARFVLFGSGAQLASILSAHNASFVMHSPTEQSWEALRQKSGRVTVVDVLGGEPTSYSHAPTEHGGRVQLASLDAALDAIKAGACDALVTAPMSKEAVNLAGTPFSGHTEYLAQKAGLARDEVTMLFAGPRLRVSLVTTHVAIHSLREQVTEPRIARAAHHLVSFLRARARQSQSFRIAVCGLNPHAGEGGVLGTDEQHVICPAVDALRKSFADVEWVGPIGAETAMRWASASEVDGVVAQFHDQATIASKLLDWGHAVNVTWGLPYLRVSVDHGVAYDAAASGRADATGMDAATRLAIEMVG